MTKKRSAIQTQYDDTEAVQLIVAWWTTLAAAYDLPHVVAINTRRRKGLLARMREPAFQPKAIVDAIGRSSFLRGKNDRGWRITFDWLFLSSTNYIKVLEGQYDDNRRAAGSTVRGRETFDANSVAELARLAKQIGADSDRGGGERDGAGS
jgi:hypothetical protein